MFKKSEDTVTVTANQKTRVFIDEVEGAEKIKGLSLVYEEGMNNLDLVIKGLVIQPKP